jgi:hypothetical protein
MSNLTTEEKATNFETYQHINNVMLFLSKMQKHLIDRMFEHDRSKLAPPEVEVFTRSTERLKGLTYGSEEYKACLADMKPALDHHYAENRHHPEHWPKGVDDMDLIDLTEMFCDWYAATLRHENGDIFKSIEINQKRFDISPQLTSIFKNSVELLKPL